jgi:hypothetical protein
MALSGLMSSYALALPGIATDSIAPFPYIVVEPCSADTDFFPLEYHWSFDTLSYCGGPPGSVHYPGDAARSPVITFSEPGEFIITLTVGNQCGSDIHSEICIEHAALPLYPTRKDTTCSGALLVPSSMMAGEEVVVTLEVVGASSGDLLSACSDIEFACPSDPPRSHCVLRVRLLDPHNEQRFKITPLNNGSQCVMPGAVTKWSWVITAVRHGDHAIALAVEVPQTPDGTVMQNSILLRRSISVDSTVLYDMSLLWSSNWPWFMAVLGLFVSIATLRARAPRVKTNVIAQPYRRNLSR